MSRDLTYHGGRIEAAARLYPDAPRPWLDLSTGINPYPWTPPAGLVVDQQRLPSGEALAGLLAAAGAAFGFAGALAAVPGSELALRLMATLDLPRPWHVVTPCYRTHRDALPGARAIAAEQIDEVAARGGTVLLANPNNPDGRLIAPDVLLAIARTLGERGGVLIVDEAFADAVAGASVLPLLRADDPVVVLRSFGKFYGLAGVRLGFVGGARSVVARIAALLGDWPVSATALAYGAAAYRDVAWAERMRLRLGAEAVNLDALLARRGLLARGACPLFRLVEHDRAGAMFERLAAAGILTRPFEERADWLRFGLPGGEVERLEAALAVDG
ncbi:aminotransferase class I/II-fold pyridoxal phosphate-dependent enzyme [Sphingomonas sp. 8AM]|uniref:aminotransferase class I/II-fold pyridoxal phosphate-dependent enzyme n=1 Tax=Sphingomonas sp. 8AM TaxID=2653170 RepID=UPI0012F10242|nr:aminotransferase class I/II-fold pyridoxal phosphate-dependent enzyme [Sphingomonas sp. 8AM]VXC47941.1 Threonine-phosphate decarboxylase [Sphingomonas sp. 8AM]